MANTITMKKTKKMTFDISAILRVIARNITLIPSTLLTLLKGLSTLIILIEEILLLEKIYYEKIVNITIKSKLFHPSLKYVPFSKMNPIAITFKMNSIVKIIFKIIATSS